MYLVLGRKRNESIMIGAEIEVRVSEINRDFVKLAIKAPVNMSILRKEIVKNVAEYTNNRILKTRKNFNITRGT